jgi:hypothetical protein
MTSPILLAALLATAPPASGELLLDLDDPVLAANIGSVPLRLRVDFDQKDVVELNPASAARLRIAFEDGFDAQVGRIRLPGTQARAELKLGGKRPLPVILSSHGRDCCAGVDGSISPELLPYARIRFIRQGATPASELRRFTLASDEESGLYLPVPIAGGQISVQFSLSSSETFATASGAAMLANGYEGQFTGARRDMPLAFGVPRPVRPMALARPATLAGFAVRQALVRITDFRGRHVLPADPATPADLVVRGRQPPFQSARPAVMIGRDHLGGCSEILFEPPTRALTLSCNAPGGGAN